MRVLGYVLAILGAAVLALYAGYHFVVGFVLNDDIDAIVRAGVVGIVLGVLLVIASLIRERVRERGQESFRDVER